MNTVGLQSYQQAVELSNSDNNMLSVRLDINNSTKTHQIMPKANKSKSLINVIRKQKTLIKNTERTLLEHFQNTMNQSTLQTTGTMTHLTNEANHTEGTYAVYDRSSLKLKAPKNEALRNNKLLRNIQDKKVSYQPKTVNLIDIMRRFVVNDDVLHNSMMESMDLLRNTYTQLQNALREVDENQIMINQLLKFSCRIKHFIRLYSKNGLS